MLLTLRHYHANLQLLRVAIQKSKQELAVVTNQIHSLLSEFVLLKSSLFRLCNEGNKFWIYRFITQSNSLQKHQTLLNVGGPL